MERTLKLLSPPLRKLQGSGRRARKELRVDRQPVPGRSRLGPLRESDYVRWTKVMTARARMAVGYYDRDDVREKVLDAVLKELSR
jgi:hypothetical protein